MPKTLRRTGQKTPSCPVRAVKALQPARNFLTADTQKIFGVGFLSPLNP